MKNIKNIINNDNSNLSLEKDFDKNLDNPYFLKLINKLKLPKKELMKYTTKLEKTCMELNCCSKCSNILECANEIDGYVYYPSLDEDMIIFNYVPCHYKKEMEKVNAYKNNVYIFDIPKEIKNASLKDIDTSDKKRHIVIKWLKEFLDGYKIGNHKKGLYLSGNFGCGKTYLISAMLNELAKDNHHIGIIYYPEFLRSLKSSFGDEDSYSNQFNYIKKVELLLIDDIGAESTSTWGRDEILGTILQYRMQESLPTFFTSNLTVLELEEHLSISNKNIDKVKARRIIERIKYLTDEITLISENKRR